MSLTDDAEPGEVGDRLGHAVLRPVEKRQEAHEGQVALVVAAVARLARRPDAAATARTRMP